MKTTLQLITTVFLFLAIQTMGDAQNEMAQLDKSDLEVTEVITPAEAKEPVLSPRQIYVNQTQMATEQVVNHLALHIDYPDAWKAYAIEGEVIVEVVITNDGLIKATKIFKSLQPKFDQLVLSTIQELKQINVEHTRYQGARRLRIPVAFSLR